VAWNVLQIQRPGWLDAVYPQLSALEAVYPALGVSVLALAVVSLATAPPTRANLEPFEK
jgi:Na+/proline symporter